MFFTVDSVENWHRPLRTATRALLEPQACVTPAVSTRPFMGPLRAFPKLLKKSLKTPSPTLALINLLRATIREAFLLSALGSPVWLPN